ncbi:MAG: DUF5011 domain-containing protein, partial [Lachnospiraceae bacterium]|nr:DUF5011 domain-containing protein [Lachnospiraceae bacterium]
MKGEQLWEEETIELGDSLREDTSFYVTGNDWVMDHTRIDISDVNNHTVGDYKVRALSPFNIFTYRIHVRDTTPPVLTTGSGWKNVFETGKMYDPDILGVTAEDLSGLTFVKYYYNGQEIEKLLFTKPGRAEITVRATDGNANRTEEKLNLFVDDPPRFYGVHDQYLLIGSVKEDMDPVFAYDEVDGGLTSEIKTDLSQVDFSNIGDYRVTYSVTDGYGLESSVASTLHIVSSRTRVEEHKNDCVIIPEDLAHAVEEDFFTYRALDKPDRKWVIENCDVALINLYTLRDDGSSSSGSAFIYEITPEFVYMVSAYHVTGFLEGEPLWITFFDGSRIRTTMRSIRLSAGNEASLFRVPVSGIPYHTLVRLREVTTDENVYDYVKEGTPLLEYCKNWRGGEIESLIKDTNVISFTLSDIQKEFVDQGSYYTATRKSV